MITDKYISAMSEHIKELNAAGNEIAEREEKKVNSLVALAELQQKIAQEVNQMSAESNKSSKSQKRMNWFILIVAVLTLAVTAYGVFFSN